MNLNKLIKKCGIFVLILTSQIFFRTSEACSANPFWLAHVKESCLASSNATFKGIVSVDYLISLGYTSIANNNGFTAWCQYDYGDGSFGNAFLGYQAMCQNSEPPPPTNPTTPNFVGGSCKKGSVIKVDHQELGEVVPVVGTPFSLVYSSSKVPRPLNLPLMNATVVGPTVSPSLVKVTMTVEIADRTFTYEINNPTPNQTMPILWDGLDASGNPIEGDVAVKITTLETNNPANEFEQPTVYTSIISVPEVSGLGLGGWALSDNHLYYPSTRMLYLGSGASSLADYRETSPGVYQTVSQDGTEFYVFENGRHTQTLNAIKGTVKYTFSYDAEKRLLSVTDAFNNITTFNRDASGTITSIVGPYGHITTLTLNARGYLKIIRNPNFEKYEMTYATPSATTSPGYLQTFKKPNGVISTFSISSGKLISDISSAGSGFTINSVPTLTGHSVTGTTAQGVIETILTEFNGDEFKRTTTPAGQAPRVMSYNKDTVGQTNTHGNTDTNMSFDTWFKNDPRFGAMVRFKERDSLITPYGNIGGTLVVQKAAYLNQGNIFDIVELNELSTYNGKTTQVYYEGPLSKFTTVTPMGKTSYTVIDEHERPVETKQFNLKEQNYFYDTNGRLTKIQQGPRVTDFAYNTKGLLRFVKNSLGQTTQFAYDRAGRKISQTEPDGRVINYSYDSMGNVTSITPPGKPAQDMTYNGFDLISSFLSSNPTTYTYNNDQDIKTITRPNGDVITYNYDSTSGKLYEITTPQGNYSLSQDPNWDYVNQMTSPDNVVSTLGHNGDLVTAFSYSGSMNGSLAFTYNNDFLMSSYTVDSEPTVEFAYNNDNQVTRVADAVVARSATNGLVKKVHVARMSEEMTHNVFGEILTAKNMYSTTTNVYSNSYVRDELGRITSRTETVATNPAKVHVYTYDLSGRLTDVTVDGVLSEHYEYDSNSNRVLTTRGGTTTVATYNLLDQLVTFGAKNYTYTVNGEVATVVDTSTTPQSVTSYTYDSFGVLKSATLANGTVVSYLHDSLRRPVVKKVGANIIKKYLWLDETRLAAEYTPIGTVISQFIYATKSNVPDYMIKAGIKYKLVTNHIGSVVSVIKASNGLKVQEITYDEFGRVLSDTRPGFQPFGFAGGIYDSDTKLVHFGARDYDSETGRWMSKDPILFAGGDTNLYGYVLQDPVNKVDPEGQSWARIGAIIIGAIATHFTAKQIQKEYRNNPEFRNFIDDRLPESLKKIINSNSMNDQKWKNQFICTK